MAHYTLTRWVNLIFFANFPARGIPAVVHLLASLRLALDTTAAPYLATTCNAAEISRIQVIINRTAIYPRQTAQLKRKAE